MSKLRYTLPLLPTAPLLYYFTLPPTPQKNKATLISSISLPNAYRLMQFTLPPSSHHRENSKDITHITFTHPDLTVPREYTPLDADSSSESTVRLVVRDKPGIMANLLSSMKEGDDVHVRSGGITLPAEKWRGKKDIIMIAGGTGVTPFIQLADILRRGQLEAGHSGSNDINSADSNNGLIIDEQSQNVPPKLHLYHSPLPKEVIALVDSSRFAQVNEVADFRSAQLMTRLRTSRYSPDTLFLVCGPEPFIWHVAGRREAGRGQGEYGGILKELGVAADHVIKL